MASLQPLSTFKQTAGRRALVIGGSLGGLFAANLLRATGWEVAVFERSQSDLSGRGAGLGTREELFAVLRKIGVLLDDSIGTEVRSRICLGPEGEVVCEVPIGTIATAWDRIYRVLRQKLPDECYHPGKLLVNFVQNSKSITAMFADGSRADGDLLVAADGMHSTVRRQLLPEIEPDYAGYVAWRTVAVEDDVPAAFRDTALRDMNFCFPEGEFALTVPMCRASEAGSPRRCQVSWFRPVDFEIGLPAMCTDAQGHCHGISIPPPLIREELIAETKAQAEMMLPPQVAALFRAARQPVLQPIFDLESPRLAFGRAVLLGDAAFVARPHVGTGVTKAALDAQCLADAMVAADDNLDAALAYYDRERVRFGRWLVARGRYLGAYLTAQHKPREQRHGQELYRRPEVVLREFGSAGVIEGSPPMPGLE